MLSPYKRPPFTGHWIGYRCGSCQHEFLLDMPRSKLAKLIHQWKASSCPRCKSRDVTLIGLAMC